MGMHVIPVETGILGRTGTTFPLEIPVFAGMTACGGGHA